MRHVKLASKQLVTNKRSGHVLTPIYNTDFGGEDKFTHMRETFQGAGFKELPMAHNNVEQFSVDVMQQLMKNLVSSPNSMISVLNKGDEKTAHELDTSTKSQRKAMINYNELQRKFYNELQKDRYAKKTPLHRGNKLVNEYMTLTGTRKLAPIITDFWTKQLRTLVRYKREDQFYRLYDRVFKLRIISNGLFSYLYKQNDVRGFMHRLRTMSINDYLVKNTLLHRKNLKISVNFNKTN